MDTTGRLILATIKSKGHRRTKERKKEIKKERKKERKKEAKEGRKKERKNERRKERHKDGSGRDVGQHLHGLSTAQDGLNQLTDE